jgi:hypothetical protein
MGLIHNVCFTLQESYVEDVTKTHGEGFDWENAPVDGQAVYVSRSRKAHGWWDFICFLILWMQVIIHYSYCYLFLWMLVMFPRVLDSRQARHSRGSSLASSPSLRMQQKLAQERAASKVKDDYLVAHMAQMERAMMVRKHNTTHPFCFSDIYVLTPCNYRN